jgi:hypothetical protein
MALWRSRQPALLLLPAQLKATLVAKAEQRRAGIDAKQSL